MSSPQDLLREGRVADALVAQIDVVRSKPSDPDERLFLFLLLCFQGDLERAQIHLDTLVTLETETRGGASVYHALVAAEYERQTIFTTKGKPTVAPGEFSGVEERVRALQLLRQGQQDAACEAIERANEAAVDRAGKINGTEFTSICDYDDLLGDVLEVHAGGRYMWLPLEGVRRITIDEPRNHLDLLWVPAEIERTHGENASVHLPALYPRTSESGTDAIRLGRSTEWIEIGEDTFRGVGQKLFFGTRGDETFEQPLLETRLLEFVDPTE